MKSSGVGRDSLLQRQMPWFTSQDVAITDRWRHKVSSWLSQEHATGLGQITKIEGVVRPVNRSKHHRPLVSALLTAFSRLAVCGVFQVSCSPLELMAWQELEACWPRLNGRHQPQKLGKGRRTFRAMQRRLAAQAGPFTVARTTFPLNAPTFHEDKAETGLQSRKCC